MKPGLPSSTTFCSSDPPIHGVTIDSPGGCYSRFGFQPFGSDTLE
ncbi:hypothetical protein GGQ64_005397 [Rhizobium azooxidifex]|uniref:Uncharacterized protein n=1 Tax=Mycoplana azooxidifex TaxID=1636188 RepID=A0A7W6DGF4_9HYPH|nr:hypothetical protein [Mycoplana azooxidifex]MBB3980145.1 hypothetical protein [Mycoplana azooxidifex]